MSGPNKLRRHLREQVAGMNLLQILAHLDGEGWGWKLVSDPQPDGTTQYLATVFGKDDLGGGKKKAALGSPATALTSAYVDCVCRRVQREKGIRLGLTPSPAQSVQEAAS